MQAEVAWDGERLASRYLARVGRDQVVERLRMSLRDPDPAAIDRVLKVTLAAPVSSSHLPKAVG